MTDRFKFISSVSGVQCPEIIAQFFDQFIALSDIIIDSNALVEVEDNNDQSISVQITFNDAEAQKASIDLLSKQDHFTVYQRVISVSPESTGSNKMRIHLQ